MMAYFIYNAVITTAFTAALPFLPLFFWKGQRFWAGFGQRLGFYPTDLQLAAAKSFRPIWIHAASVGEVRSAQVLTQKLKQLFPQRAIVLSAFTHTGNLTARQNPCVDRVLYLPLDLCWTARRALGAFEPAVLVFLETEVWPNLLREANRKGIPTILLSGRLSEKGFRSYSRFIWFFRQVFRFFSACGMQSEIDRQRIIRLGVAPQRVFITGNLKQAAILPDAERLASARESGRVAGDYLWVVGSSHRGEEEIALTVFKRLRNKFPGLRMVLAPRHPQRFAEVERILVAGAVSFQKRSETDGNRPCDYDVMFLDTIGDLENFYSEADVAFVGGSLIDAGGHNLLEPARFAKPVLFGPYTSNVASLARSLRENGGGFEVRDADDLATRMTMLLSDGQIRKNAGEKAYEIASADSSVIENSLKLIATYLAAPGDRMVAVTAC